MIAYFDTSAIVPLLIDEPSTERCRAHWLNADRVVTVALTSVEARAALAMAARMGRITAAQLRTAADRLSVLLDQAELVTVDDDLLESAADLAETRALRAYDAVHLAAAVRVHLPGVVVVAGDTTLLTAASAEGLATVDSA